MQAISDSPDVAMLIAGSKHTTLRVGIDDSESSYVENVSKLFCWNPHVDGDILNEAKLILNHYKRKANSGKGESLLERRTNVPLYITPFGNIQIFISSEIMNIELILAQLANVQSESERPLLIIVLSCNEGPTLSFACRYLSYFSGCAVIQVDSGDRDFRYETVRFFISGFDSTEVPAVVRRIAHDSAKSDHLERWASWTTELQSEVVSSPQHSGLRVGIYEIDLAAILDIAHVLRIGAGLLRRSAELSRVRIRKL